MTSGLGIAKAIQPSFQRLDEGARSIDASSSSKEVYGCEISFRFLAVSTSSAR
jgi:hypothetical protein